MFALFLYSRIGDKGITIKALFKSNALWLRVGVFTPTLFFDDIIDGLWFRLFFGCRIFLRWFLRFGRLFGT